MRLLKITEYGTPQPLIAQLAEAAGLTMDHAESAVIAAGERIRRQHRLRNNPIQIVGGQVKAEDVAGVISLHPGVDLEIVPKYAPVGVDWAADLLFLTLFTTYGRLDVLKPISAGIGKGNALAELAAHVLLDLIRANARTPLRLRQRVTFHSFEPDAEIDPEDMLAPEDEGWRQSGHKLTFDNRYVATLSGACKMLLPHVRSVAVRSQLSAQIMKFGRQTQKPLRGSSKLPPRLTRWQGAMDLALALLEGGSLSPKNGSMSTLGFTISTWRTWEALIERALIIGIGGSKVRPQPTLMLGTATRGALTKDVPVQPDAVITTLRGDLVMDAKYKGRADQPLVGISASDRYEIMAFMLAAKTRRAALVYPSLLDEDACGVWRCFEKMEMPSGEARAYTICVNGISQPGGFTAFMSGLRNIVSAAYP